MIIKDITDYLESIAPLSLQESYDNSGLILGEPNCTVNKALITLDVTEIVLNEAIEKKCNIIIAHHPIIFSGLKKLNNNSLTEKIIFKAIKNDVSIYAIHTNLDNVIDGVNGILAKKLGIKNVRTLVPKNETYKKIVCFCPLNAIEDVKKVLFKAGAGSIGNYAGCSFSSQGVGTFVPLHGSNPYVGKQNSIHGEDEYRVEVIIPHYKVNEAVKAMIDVHPYEEPAYDVYNMENINMKIGSGLIGELDKPIPAKDFLLSVKKNINVSYIKHNKLIERPVAKVAICGGSGAFLIDAAARNKADIFISSDIKYHDFLEHTGNMTIADAGHYETEQPVKELLYSLLKENFPNFAVQISEENANPISYI